MYLGLTLVLEKQRLEGSELTAFSFMNDLGISAVFHI